MQTTSWMREDRDDNVKVMLDQAHMAEEIKNHKGRYQIIADLMKRGSADITADTGIFLALNRPRDLEDRERLTLEEYMKFFPEECEDALYVAAQRRSENECAYNMKSQAKWHHLGEMPPSVAQLIVDMYPESEDKKAAFKRFFNSFPKFRISSKRI